MTRALIVALVAALALAGWQYTRALHLKTDLAELRADIDRQVREAEQQARATEQARTAKIQEALDDAHKKRTIAEADARRASAASVSLRKYADSLAARCAPASPEAPASSPATEAPGLVLANMLGRLDEAAGELARYADEARIAGEACQGAYVVLIRRQ